MKDAYEVLYKKEAEVARVRREIESLNMVASLLADDQLSFFEAPGSGLDEPNKKPAEKEVPVASNAKATGTGGLSGTGSRSQIARRASLWGSLKRRW